MKITKKNSGFTLLELIVAVALLGILATAAGPSLRSFVSTTRVNAAESDMNSALILARTEAVRQRTQVYVKPVNASDWADGWFVTSDVSDVAGDCGTVDTCLQVYDAHEIGVNDYLGPSYITFNKDGRTPTGSDALLIFCDSDWSSNRNLSYIYASSFYSRPRWLECCYCSSFGP